MKINEVEALLGISKANIRFYEKQNLLRPNRADNGYREYSQEDIERLQSIIILRKLGISVQNIEMILAGDLLFQQAIQENISELEAQLEQLEGSLKLSRQIAEEQNDTLDVPRYWDIIQQKEAQGEQFVDVVSDYWVNIMQPTVFRRFGLKEGMSLKRIAIQIAVICGIYALVRTFVWKDGNLLTNFLYWPMVIGIGTLITFPIFWLGKHNPKIASVLNGLLLGMCIIVLGGALLLLLFGTLSALWNALLG